MIRERNISYKIFAKFSASTTTTLIEIAYYWNHNRYALLFLNIVLSNIS